MGSAIGGAAGMIGGLIGNASTQGERDSADALNAQALASAQGLSVPDLEKAIQLQQYQQAGQLTPTMANAASAGPSAYSQISEDPTLRNAQMNALSQLQSAGRTGLTAQDMANLQQTQNAANQQAQQQQASVLQQAQQRGMGDSGNSIAAQLMAGQNSANQQNQAGLQIAGTASQRALQAIQNAATQAGATRSQDYGVAANRAAAQDQMSRFNTQNQQAANMYNAQASNQANAANLSNAQSVANANTGINNAEKQREVNAQQTQYTDSLSKNNALSSALNGRATEFNNQANATNQQWSGGANALGQGIAAAFGVPSMPSSTKGQTTAGGDDDEFSGMS